MTDLACNHRTPGLCRGATLGLLWGPGRVLERSRENAAVRRRPRRAAEGHRAIRPRLETKPTICQTTKQKPNPKPRGKSLDDRAYELLRPK